MSEYRVLLYYKYAPVANPELMVKEHQQFCDKNNLKGRIFIASEGINGTLSGLQADTENYKSYLRSIPQFSDIIFKEDEADEHAFIKMHVRLKNEIVHSGLKETSIVNGGKRLSPEQLLEFYESGKDFLIVDARNWYEAKVGKFKNAIDPELKTFRDWTKAAEQLKEQKDKTVVTYCTGGIRCEKASAYLVEQGFKDVYQLDGGIVSYTKKYPDTYWEGGIWVFDERRVVEPNSKEDIRSIAECHHCGEKTSYYINCHNLNCDKILVCCHDCKTEHEYCCSDECKKSENKRPKLYG